ncbi:MAG TPA: hypothetical protein DCP37_15955 [Dehalococcoidia bacterium]|nr:hypothetical protein [Dehalococcoidia bacterium]
MFTSGESRNGSVVAEILRKLDLAVSWAGRAVEVHLSRRWPVLAAIGVAGLVIAGMAVAYAGASLALSDDIDLEQLRGAVDESLLDEEGAGLEGASADVDLLRDRSTMPLRLIRWAGRMGPSIAWLPIASTESMGLAAQAGRVDSDLDAASSLLEWAAKFTATFEQAESAMVRSGDRARIAELRSSLEEIGTGFEDGRTGLSDQGRSAGYALMTSVPPFSGMFDDLETAEVSLVRVTQAGESASRLVAALLDLAEASQPLLTQFSGDAGAEGNGAEPIYVALTDFRQTAIDARSSAADVIDAISELGGSGAFSEKLEALDRLMDAAVIIGEAGVLGFEALRPAYEIISQSESGILDGEGVLPEALATLRDRTEEIDDVIARLAEAEETLRDLVADGSILSGSTGLPGMLDYVAEVRSGLELVNGIAPVADELLGHSDPRKYLMLGQSADELRGTGGFVSGIWTMTVQDGSLDGVSYYDVVRVDDWDRLVLYPAAPPGLEEHMNAWVWLLRDVSWDPDFRATAQSASAMFKIGQNQDVDGVLAINQWALLGLVQAVGGITPPEGGEPITANNLITVLERGTDLHGRAYMDLVLQGLIDEFASQSTLPGLVRLASAVLRALESKDLVFYFENSDAQNAVEDLGWAGAVEPTAGDYLYVVDSNVGWSKVDRNIEREISYVVDLSRVERPRATLNVGYTNHSGPDSPPCEPQWLNRGADYSQLVNACYWDFVRVYMSEGSRILSQSELPLPELSVSVEIGKGVPGQETGAISALHDKAVFSGLLIVPAGSSREVSLVYDLPGRVVKQDGNSVGYELLLQKQPGVRDRNVSIHLIPPDGYSVSASSVPYALLGDGRVRLNRRLNSDESIRVSFAKDRAQGG